MFWGLIMEPNKRYTQTVERPFHVSMATLDVSTADDEIVQVMLCYDNRNYLLCNLKKGVTWQVPLDLNFQEGTKIAFTSNGLGHVHLTGYLIPEDLDDFEDEEVDDEEDDEEAPQLVSKQGKRKAQVSPQDFSNALKKLKSDLENEASSDDENDENDESMEAEAEDDDDDSDESLVDEDDDTVDEEEESEDEAESESEEEEQKKSAKPQPKQQQQQKNKQKDAKDKSTDKSLVNGKDTSVQKKSKKEQQIEQQQQQQVQKKKVLGGGVIIEELKIGEGNPAKAGKFVSVYYIGKLKNGKKFDATQKGEGFKFRLGGGEVIKGWDIGVAGMKVGGKRRITVPPAMGYGNKGSPPVIPGNSVLVFDVELKKVH